MMINGIPLPLFAELFAWGCFGFMASVVFQLMKHQNDIKREGGFSAGYWLIDNRWRLVGAFFAIVIGVTFHGEFSNGQMTPWDACLVGAFSDTVVDSFLKKKK